MKAAAIFALGVGLLAFSVWARRGRSRAARWWPGGPMSEATILCVYPGLGLMAVAGGIYPALDEIPASEFPVSLVGLAGILVGLWGISPLPIPQRWFPKWAWEESWTREHRDWKARRKAEKARRRG